MDNNLFNILIAILTLVISIGGGYVIKLIKQNLGRYYFLFIMSLVNTTRL